MNRLLMVLLFLVVLGSLFLSNCSGSVCYTITKLPFHAEDINDLGQMAGTSAVDSSTAAVLWLPAPAYGFPAGMNILGILGNPSSQIRGINDLGQIVGWVFTSAIRSHPILWLPEPAYGLPAGFSNLPIINQWPVIGPTDLNNKGQIASSYFPAPGYRYPFVWLPEPDYGFPAGFINLGTFGGTQSRAVDINEQGQAVGDSPTSEGNSRAFIWLPVTAYGLPPGLNNLGTLGGRSSAAIAINESGQVVGSSANAAGQGRGFIWLPEPEWGLPKGMNELETPSGSQSTANDINDLGQIIGTLTTATGERHLALWLPEPAYGVPAGMYDLSTLGGYSNLLPLAINNHGQILVSGSNEQGSSTLLINLLTPPPVSMNKPDTDVILKMQLGWWHGTEAWYICTDANSIRFAMAPPYPTLAPKLSSFAVNKGAAEMFIVTNPSQTQGPVFSTRPGEASYSGVWAVSYVRWKPGYKRVPIGSVEQIQILENLGQVIVSPTDIRLDCPIVAIDRLDGPWHSKLSSISYRIPQGISYDLYEKELKLPAWTVYCQNPTTRLSTTCTIIIPDASNPDIAAELGSNYAPGLASADPSNTQKLFVISPPRAINQYPVLEFCPCAPGWRNTNYDYSPVVALEPIQLPAIAGSIPVINNASVLNELVQPCSLAGYLNAPVVDCKFYKHPE